MGGRPGGKRPARRGLILALLLAGGCAEEVVPNPHPPDALLVDSLGLGPDVRVHRVVLVARGNVESIAPALTEVAPGAWVDFRTGDGRVHELRFQLDRIDAEQRAFLRRTGQESSPPLIDRGSRFVVSFEGAPAGRYPFVVEGNGAPGSGAIVVASAADGR